MMRLPFVFFFTVLSFPYYTSAYLDFNSSLTIPKQIPKNTFVIHTLIDRNTVDYSGDANSGGDATGQCKNHVHHSSSNNEFYLAGPCLTTIDAETEQYIIARCRPQWSSAITSGDNIHIHLYLDDQTGKAVVDVTLSTVRPSEQALAWYGFGSESNNTPLHNKAQTFNDPDSIILINCVNDKRNPIAG